MNCALHPNIAAITNCASCQTPLCKECAVADSESKYLCSRCVALSAVSDYNQVSEQKQKNIEQRDIDEELHKKSSLRLQVIIISICMIIIAFQLSRVFSDDLFMAKFEEPATLNETAHSDRCMAYLLATNTLIEPGTNLHKDDVAKYCNEPPFIITQTYNEISVKSPNLETYGFSEVRIDRESLFPDFD